MGESIFFFFLKYSATSHVYQDEHKRWMDHEKYSYCLFSFLVQNAIKNTKTVFSLFVCIAMGHNLNSPLVYKAEDCWKKIKHYYSGPVLHACT